MYAIKNQLVNISDLWKTYLIQLVYKHDAIKADTAVVIDWSWAT